MTNSNNNNTMAQDREITIQQQLAKLDLEYNNGSITELEWNTQRYPLEYELEVTRDQWGNL
jgi:hypothetical protein